MSADRSAAPTIPGAPASGRVCVFAPTPLLTVAVEPGDHGDSDVHLHAGGQGPWVANMLRVLETAVVLCGPLGGETGRALAAALDFDRLEIKAVTTAHGNGCYVEERRGGEMACLAEMRPPTLTRHQIDDLYGQVLATALRSTLTVLTGPASPAALDADLYRRLAADLRRLGVRLVADLSGEPLAAALAGRGLAVLKVSDEELIAGGWATSADPAALAATMADLRPGVSEMIVVTRSDRPALAMIGEECFEVRVPRLEPVHPRGAGDSMTAGIAAALARGDDLDAALRLGAAAGALNVTRRGLASGQRDAIEQLAGRVEVRAGGPERGRST